MNETSPLLPQSPHVAARFSLMVSDSAAVLKRFYFLQREIIRLEAGWFPAIAHWETKLLLPEVMWQDSRVTHELRERVLELRYPERRLEIDDNVKLLEWFKAMGDAPHALAFTSVLSRVLKPFVRGLFQTYLECADALDDGPTVFFLSHAIQVLDRQITRLQELQAMAEQAFPTLAASAAEWRAGFAEALAACPFHAFFSAEATVPPAPAHLARLGRSFAIDRLGQRDPRFRLVRFAWPDRHTPGPAGSGRQLQVRQGVHHVNEVWAAEMAAACLHDLAPEAPAEFLLDAARWCYDEIRHCRMGYERLRAWGYADGEIPLDNFSYAAGADADPLIRLGIIFFFETTYIHTKPERTKLFRELGDRLSSHDMDFDWADELIHTHYGKRWLDHFLSATGDSRRPSDIKELASQAVRKVQLTASAADQAATEAIFQAMMSRAR